MKIPDGIYQNSAMTMVVDNSLGAISSWIGDKMAAVYKYSIKNGVISLLSLKDGVKLTDYVNVDLTLPSFTLVSDAMTFTYISPLE